ncbi:MAG: ArsR family transcriptional regulator [Candidatus Odinarchaeota archaeon]|nr:ArsR family transcriptional regulator [Candidatus Odinarchaeota archaeon]
MGVEEVTLNIEQLIPMAKALSSSTRVSILRLLSKENYDVSTIAKKLRQTEANISAQIKILEKVGLVKSYYEPGDHGVRKICMLKVGRIILNIL